jgi:natural product precursor
MQRAICINQLQKTNILILNFIKMKKFNLSGLERSNVSRKQMNRLRGGYEVGDCTCGCLYEGQPGGSTLQDNGDANYDGGFHTHGVTNGYVRSVTKTATKTTTKTTTQP